MPSCVVSGTMAEMTEDQRNALEEKLKSMSPEELKEYQKKQCIFCRMVTGEIPAKKIYEDDKVFAVLDINPASAGHVLLMPKEHYPIMQQMPDDDVSHLGVVAKGFSQSFLQVLKVEGTSIFAASGAIAGQRAQHVMVHLIPRKEGDAIGLIPPSKPLPPQDLSMVRQALQPFVDKALGVKQAPSKPLLSPPAQSVPATSSIPGSSPSKKESVDTVLPPRVQELSAQKSARSFQPLLKESQPAQTSESQEINSPVPRSKKKSAPPEQRSSLDDIADFLTKG